MSDFSGTTVLVCGGATGIGAATATLLAERGANVIVQYHTRVSEAEALCAALSGRALRATPAQADLTDEDDVTALFSAHADIDAFVHSVSAPLAVMALADMKWGDFDTQLLASVKSALLLVQAMLGSAQRMRAGVFVSSAVTFGLPPKDWSAYVTAKAALTGFVRSIAQDAAAQGLRLNCVSPGLTETPLTAHMDPRRRELAGRAAPLKRLGTVAEAAAAVAFLLSAESAYIVGADLPVAGGTVL